MTERRIAAFRRAVTRRHVLQAIRAIRGEGTPPARQSRGYVLVHEGERLPPKFVLERAMMLAGGGRIDPEDHSGYGRNGIAPDSSMEIKLAEGRAEVRIFRPWGGGRR